MSKSLVFPRHEASDSHAHEFDYHANFAQFVEEARDSACRVTFSASNPEAAGKQQLNFQKKKRKSWKSSLFSWLSKTDRKSKSTEQQRDGSSVPRAGPGHGHVSGPIQGSAGVNASRGQARSGPLIGLFSSRRADGREVPYVCLAPKKIHSYGPVYLVT